MFQHKVPLLALRGVPADEAATRATEALAAVGLAEHVVCGTHDPLLIEQADKDLSLGSS